MANYSKSENSIRNNQTVRQTILVVDHDAADRSMLCEVLAKDFGTIEAEDGQQAIEILKTKSREIELVILDIGVPVMDGHQVLQWIRTEQLLSAIPVIVASDERNEAEELLCLEEGASAYVARPYNIKLLCQRVVNILRLRDSACKLRMLEFDQLTGLYSKEFFYQHVRHELDQNPDKEYDIICSDIDNFKLINERMGVEKGDEVLRYIADAFRDALGENGLCARIGADTFVILLEHGRACYGDFLRKRIRCLEEHAPVQNMVIRFGIYMNVKRSIPVSGMCDRAMLALNHIKHQYGESYSMYDDSLRLKLLKENQMLDSMESSLKKKHFRVYYQPKHDIQTGQITGAEALVRWFHPEFGFMSPGEFIPLFEQNGFITKLDFYVWEEVCAQIRRWIDQGLQVKPVSVNVSRVDLRSEELVLKLQELVDRYQIAHELIHLEVTETAYADNPQQIIDSVKELRSRGFLIEMDDFGSGYSSLNMLSELSVDVLKLDMRFIQKKTLPNEMSILGFIIGMSRLLELDTVAEGVETEEQVEKLRKMGCQYVQGYYYAKPMPAGDFEFYMKKSGEKRAGNA